MMEEKYERFFNSVEKDMTNLVYKHIKFGEPSAMFATVGSMISMYCNYMDIDMEEFVNDLLNATVENKDRIDELLEEADDE